MIAFWRPLSRCLQSNGDEIAIEALNHGADNHFQKGRRPMAQFKELREVMAQLAHRYRANRMSGKGSLRAAIDNIEDIILRADHGGHADPICPPVTGYPLLDELINHNTFDLMHPDDLSSLNGKMEWARTDSSKRVLELHQPNKRKSCPWPGDRKGCPPDNCGELSTAMLNVGEVGGQEHSGRETPPKGIGHHGWMGSRELIPRTAEGNVNISQDIKKGDERTGDAQADRTIDASREEEKDLSPDIPFHPMTSIPWDIGSSGRIYQELVKNLPHSIVMLYDRDLRCLLLEGGGLGPSGLEGAAIKGKTVCEAFPDGPLNQCEEAYIKVLRGESVTDIISSCGRTYQRFSLPLKYEDSNVYGGMVMCHDITDVKETEENLQRYNRSLRVIAAGQQARFYTNDESGLLEAACNKLTSATGHPMTYVIMTDGKGMPRIVASSGCEGTLTGAVLPDLPPFVPGPPPADPPSWRGQVGGPPQEKWQAHCARDLVSILLHYHDDAIGALVLFNPEKGSFPPEEVELLREVARDLSLSISSLRDHEEVVRSYEMLSRKDKQMQQLSLSTRKLSSTSDEWSVLRTLMRATKELLGCETCMVGVRVGRRLLFHEMDQGGGIRPIDLEVIIGDEALGRALDRMEPFVDNKDCMGKYRNLAVVPLVDGGGHLAGALWAQDKEEGGFQPWDLRLMGSLVDSAMAALKNAEMIRCLRAREGELEQVNKKLNLIGNITGHDLLNHLTTLRGYLELARTHDNHIDYLGRALTSAGNITSHVLFALDYSEVGTQSPVWVTLREAVSRGISTIGNIEVRLEMSDGGVELYADRMIEKVFHNLLDNSICHGNASTVKITTGEGPDGLVIVYEDDGAGIPNDRKERMFELTSEHKGMYLTREILALTGMEISEQGVAGEGARFEITVPRGRYRYESLSTSD